jgi:hypothetical protein
MAHGTQILPKSSGYEVAERLQEQMGVPARYDRASRRVIIDAPRERGGRLAVTLHAAKQMVQAEQNVAETGSAFTVKLPEELVAEGIEGTPEAAALDAIAAELVGACNVRHCAGDAGHTGDHLDNLGLRIRQPMDRKTGRYIAGEPKARGKVHVSVTVTVEVDRDAYDAEYGQAATVAEIRDHIKAETVSAAESAFGNIDAIKVS